MAIAPAGCNAEELLDFLITAAKTAYKVAEAIEGEGEIEYCGDGGQRFRLLAELFAGSKQGSNQMVTMVEQNIVLNEGTNRVAYGGLKPASPGPHFVRGEIGRLTAQTDEFVVET